MTNLNVVKEDLLIKAAMNNLVDIQDIKINPNYSKEQKIEQYVKDIKDPYRFKIDDMIINIEFSDSEFSLQDGIFNYIKSKIFTD